MAMQGSPVAKLSAVPKVNAIDKIDSLPSQLSKKILLSRTKNEEHSFAKLLARAQGKKIDAQVSDAFSSSNEFHESKRASADLRRKDASKAKAVRNDDVDTKKESKTAAAKDTAKKETIDAARDVVKKQHDDTSSNFNKKKSFEHTQDESRGRMADTADEALERTEVLDAADAARAALLEDFNHFGARQHFFNHIVILVDELLHAFFNRFHVFGREGFFRGDVVVEAFFNHRADHHFGIGVELFHGMADQVRAGMADDFHAFGVFGRDDLHGGIFGNRVARIAQYAVHFAGHGGFGQSGADGCGDLGNGDGGFVLADAAVGQGDVDLGHDGLSFFEMDKRMNGLGFR